MHLLLLFLYFFFQAEDGIRDHCVTGVQTCALPIYYGRAKKLFEAGLIAQQELDARATELRMARDDLENAKQLAAVSTRSEERRVGKECRSRWSAEQLKKRNNSK